MLIQSTDAIFLRNMFFPHYDIHIWENHTLSPKSTKSNQFKKDNYSKVPISYTIYKYCITVKTSNFSTMIPYLTSIGTSKNLSRNQNVSCNRQDLQRCIVGNPGLIMLCCLLRMQHRIINNGFVTNVQVQRKCSGKFLDITNGKVTI